MGQEILTLHQKKFLEFVSQEKSLYQHFYLSGGTALAAFYLNHRISEDLDFFSQTEFNPLAIDAVLKKAKPKLGFASLDFQQSFNRNLFFLRLRNAKPLKVEFTYFPFEPLQKPKRFGKLNIDSLLDIAVNKAFTIAQQPRARDFIDLYCIFQKTPLTFKGLLKKARLKFDWHIDPIQLGSQLIKADEISDLPVMRKKISERSWRELFLKEAKALKKSIV
jgi:predicted nucleotidyltransferase component of viral defense system